MFFKRDNRIRNNVELVSLHIPKTAGTSFRSSLKDHFGEDAVQRFDIFPRTMKIRIEEQEFSGDALNPCLKVLHGHFFLDHLFDFVALKENIPKITWVRDPAERVISNYYYLERILRRELDVEAREFFILDWMQKTLEEYARAEVNRNFQARYLAGHSLESFAFVGIVEDYQNELRRLAATMGWAPLKEFHENKVISEERAQVTADLKDLIRELNSEDQRIYEEAVALRKAHG